jgi:hypothetical protein
MRYIDEGEHEIYFNRSDDNGVTWQGEYRLTFGMGDGLTPWISYNRGNIHVVWREDVRPPEQSINVYYKKYSPDPSSVTYSGESLPHEIEISVWPNPFNSSALISVESQNPGSIKIYDILGKIIRRFDYRAGTSKLIWNARDVQGGALASGMYFIRAGGGEASKTLKVEYLK